MRRLFRSCCLGLFFVVGCSSTNADLADPSTDEDEVRTAECPSTFSLDLDKPAIFARTPTKSLDGCVGRAKPPPAEQAPET